MPDRAIFLVDGFNLYHALAADKRLRQYKWLDLKKLCSSFLSCKEALSDIFFFTAYYPGTPDRRIRHQTYIRANEYFGVKPVFGEFKRKDKYCENCKKTFSGFEEKQTDVNIAITLFQQAVKDTYDTAFIISGDSDLLPAIRAVRATFPEKKIKIIIPPGRSSESLKNEADFAMRMKERHLRDNQLPDPVLVGSTTVAKPKGW